MSGAIALVRLAWLAVLAMTLVLAGCNGRVSNAAEAAALAEAQFEAGNIEEARESIQEAVLARDDVAEYFILLGRIELAANKPSAAFNAYSRALDLQADNLDVLQAIAELGLQTDRLREADEAAGRILLLFPGSTRAMLVKGFIAIDRGRLDDAHQFVTDILAQNPDDEGGAVLSARLSAIEGKFEEAISKIEKVRATSPDNAALDATLLEIYRAQGNARGMRSVFPKIIAAADQEPKYQLDYVNLLYKSGPRVEARKEALESVGRNPNNPVLMAGLMQLYLEYDSEPLSSKQVEALAQRGTRVSQLAFSRFFLEIGRLDNSSKMIARLIEEDVPEAQALGSRVALAQGNAKVAALLAQAVLESDPRNPDALLTRSALSLRKGKVDAAIEDANIVVSDAPQEYAGYVALAKAQLAKGSQLRARQVFERGIDALPQSRLLAAEYSHFLRRVADRSRLISLQAERVAAAPSSINAAQTYMAVCSDADDNACRAKAERAASVAARSLVIDDAPGTPKDRGLFSRITPEQICKATGGICTAS